MTPVKRIVRTSFLALFIMGNAGFALHAQEKSASPKQKPPSSERETVETAPNSGPGRQLAHQSNEAAGEGKDEMAEFKESGSVRVIAKYVTGGNLQYAYWMSVALNFAVIAAVIIWAGKKFLPGMFRDRTASIQKAMQEAQKASEEARRKLAEIESRLAKLDVEIGTMRDAAEKEGAAEAGRIKAAAEEDARKIVASAEQEIMAAIKAARRQLTAYAADLAVGLAQKQIHVDAATDQVLVHNFAGQLGIAPEKSGKDGN